VRHIHIFANKYFLHQHVTHAKIGAIVWCNSEV